jgi:hypothetical protein
VPPESTQKSPTAVCWSASKNASASPKVPKFVLLATSPLSYRQFIETQGKFFFGWYSQDVDVRSGVPLNIRISHKVAGSSESVTVEGGGDLVENDPSFHTDVDRGP